jgi:hypothetical protein
VASSDIMKKLNLYDWYMTGTYVMIGNYSRTAITILLFQSKNKTRYDKIIYIRAQIMREGESIYQSNAYS